MEVCSMCHTNVFETIIHCQDCSEKFCPNCYKTCPAINMHEPSHRYTVQRTSKLFLRDGTTFQEEMNLLKQVEHSGSLKRNYSDFYIDGKIGDVTVSRKRPKIIDHTEKLQDSQECKTDIGLEDQISLGRL